MLSYKQRSDYIAKRGATMDKPREARPFGGLTTAQRAELDEQGWSDDEINTLIRVLDDSALAPPKQAKVIPVPERIVRVAEVKLLLERSIDDVQITITGPDDLGGLSVAAKFWAFGVMVDEFKKIIEGADCIDIEPTIDGRAEITLGYRACYR